MPDPLPIGTEYDATHLGLRVRVVGHHKDQFGQVVNDVVKVGELPRKGRAAKRAAPIMAGSAPAPNRPRRKVKPRRRYYYRPRLPQTKPVKVPWTTGDYIAAWVWCIILVGGFLLFSTCDAHQRTHQKYVGPPMASVRHRR
jgi:hypothetical protein